MSEIILSLEQARTNVPSSSEIALCLLTFVPFHWWLENIRDHMHCLLHGRLLIWKDLSPFLNPNW